LAETSKNDISNSLALASPSSVVTCLKNDGNTQKPNANNKDKKLWF